jgi:hypothetical protein
MQRLVRADPFDRRNFRSVGLHGKDGATFGGRTVDEHGARTATRRVATNVRSRQSELFAERVNQEHSGFDFERTALAVDLDLDL